MCGVTHSELHVITWTHTHSTGIFSGYPMNLGPIDMPKKKTFLKLLYI